MATNDYTANEDQVNPQTIEELQEFIEVCFDNAFADEANLDEIKQLIVNPYCDKHGINHDAPLAQMFAMYVLGFDSGMGFVQLVDTMSK